MWLDDGHVRVWLPCEWVMDAGVHVDRRKEEGAAATFRRSLLVRVAALVSRPRSIRLHFTPVPVPVPVPVRTLPGWTHSLHATIIRRDAVPLPLVLCLDGWRPWGMAAMGLGMVMGTQNPMDFYFIRVRI